VNGKLFLLMVGVGFDAAVVHALARIRRGPITMVDYALPAAWTVATYQFPSLRVKVDGGSPELRVDIPGQLYRPPRCARRRPWRSSTAAAASAPTMRGWLSC